MATGYLKMHGINFTRREVSSIVKKHRNEKIDHFDRQALERVDSKLKKNGFLYIHLHDNIHGELIWNFIRDEHKFEVWIEKK